MPSLFSCKVNFASQAELDSDELFLQSHSTQAYVNTSSACVGSGFRLVNFDSEMQRIIHPALYERFRDPGKLDAVWVRVIARRQDGNRHPERLRSSASTSIVSRKESSSLWHSTHNPRLPRRTEIDGQFWSTSLQETVSSMPALVYEEPSLVHLLILASY